MPPPSTVRAPGQAVTEATTSTTTAMLKSYFPPPSLTAPPFWASDVTPLHSTPPGPMGGADGDVLMSVLVLNFGYLERCNWNR